VIETAKYAKPCNNSHAQLQRTALQHNDWPHHDHACKEAAKGSTSKEVGRSEDLQLLTVVGTVGILALSCQHLWEEAVQERRER